MKKLALFGLGLVACLLSNSLCALTPTCEYIITSVGPISYEAYHNDKVIVTVHGQRCTLRSTTGFAYDCPVVNSQNARDFDITINNTVTCSPAQGKYPVSVSMHGIYDCYPSLGK